MSLLRSGSGILKMYNAHHWNMESRTAIQDNHSITSFLAFWPRLASDYYTRKLCDRQYRPRVRWHIFLPFSRDIDIIAVFRRIRLAAQDTSLSRRRSRVRIPYALPILFLPHLLRLNQHLTTNHTGVLLTVC